MRALVISGGGSKGAFAGGVAQHLIDDLNIKYDIFVGTSTGSLLAPLISAGNLENVKKAYTSVTQDDIYNICPFKIKHMPDGTVKSSINHLNVIMMLLKKRKTLGEHKNLRKTINRFFSEEDFNRVKASSTKVVVTVANLSLKKVEYKYLSDCEYEDFCDWMWISTSFVPFMSLVEKNGYEYADGGFGNYIPVEEAIAQGANEIDVIVLNPRHRVNKKTTSKNTFDILINSMQFMLTQIAYDDIMIGHLQSIYNDSVKVRFFFTPRLLTDLSFYFDPVQMKAWWDEGYEYAVKKMESVIMSSY